MADPYASFSTPAKAAADPYAAFAKPVTSSDVTAGGVQDYEPMASRHIGTMELPKDEAAGWATTRIRNAATGLAGVPRAISDLVDYGASAVGASPKVASAIKYSNPLTMAGQFLPSTKTMNDAASTVLPTVNTPGKYGKVVDVGVESAIGGLALGGGASSILPSLAGGATSEIAGQAAEGSKWEPAARVLGGLFGGGVVALGQNALQSAWQGIRNLKPNVDEASSKILSKAIQRDKMTPEKLVTRQAELGPGATVAEAGGPNVRGTVRGAIAAPGEARTNVLNSFDDRIKQVNDQATASLDKNISRNNSLATTVDDLATSRSAASGPAYESAGIPQKRADLPNADRLMASDDLLVLLDKSPDVQAALRNARRVPELRDQPTNSMAVLDRVYKHLGGIEQQARDAGNKVRAGDIKDIRTRLGAAIGEENPAYTNALSTYAEPSKLIDAAAKGKDWFNKNVDPAVVRKEFAAMSPDEQQSALIGVRDWARDVAGRSDRGIVAERVWSSDNNRQRFQAILETPGFEDLGRTMETSKNAIRTARDINVGSRTAPMLNEQADNAGQMNALADLAQGRPISAAGNWLKGITERLATGRNEAVNARLAEIATMTDPSKVGLVAAMANRAALEEAARSSGRGNALRYGTAVPTANALVGERR
jgi:hypothetical protein